MALKRSRGSEEPESPAYSDGDDQSVNGSPSKPATTVASTTMAGSPTKRARRMASFPQTPTTALRTAVMLKSSNTAAFTTPARNHVTYAPLYPLQACDSPSNPFGRKHSESLIRNLPPPTSFSKHLALRFQFVRKGVPFSGGGLGGVCRIVQVPLSYTFVHLRCLISFLFDGPGSGTRGRIVEDHDHLFEIKKEVERYSVTYKPGQIKKGRTWAKLSSTRDPCRWRAEENEIDEDDDIDEAEEAGRDFGEGDDEWEWKDEEDFTLAHAWPDGLNESRGIVYYHSRTTQIHITVNTGRVERRRGSGNTPYVFSAKGHVHLSEVPLQRVLFKTSSAKGKEVVLRSGRVTRNSSRILSSKPTPRKSRSPDNEEDDELDGFREFDENHPFNNHRRETTTKFRAIEDEADDDDDEEEDDLEQDFYVDLKPKRWNKPDDAFAVYLRRYMGPPPPPSTTSSRTGGRKPINLFNDDDDEEVDQLAHSLDEEEFEEVQDDTLIVYRDHDEDEDDLNSTPGLTFSSSSHAASSSPHRLPHIFPSSSPAHLPPPPSSSPQRPSGVRFDADVMEFPSPSIFHSPSIIFPRRAFKDKITPAPRFKTKRHRKRWERVERQIEKSKRGKILRLKVGDDDVNENGEEEEEEGGVEGEEEEEGVDGEEGEGEEGGGKVDGEVEEGEADMAEDYGGGYGYVRANNEDEEVDQLDEDEDEYDIWSGCVGSSEI